MASLCLLSAGQKVGAPARPAKCPEGVSASKESIRNFKKGKGDQKSFFAKECLRRRQALKITPHVSKEQEKIIKKFQKTKNAEIIKKRG